MTFPNLESAVRCAIHNGTHWHEIKPDRWCVTYHCKPRELERVWKDELTKETNCNSMGEGKWPSHTPMSGAWPQDCQKPT